MAYVLGKTSRRNLEGVHPSLVEMVEECIKITPVDFTILNNGGLRTTSQQAALYKKGASQIDGRNKKSKHQKQNDGYGHAVDLVPYMNGGPRWEWPLIYPIAASMALLSKTMGVPIRWGGVWDRNLEDYAPPSCASIPEYIQVMKKAVSDYTVRHRGPDFIDGPHYELL